MKRLFMTTWVMLTLSVSFASCGTDDTEFAPNTGVPAPPANNDDNSSSGGGYENSEKYSHIFYRIHILY